MAALSETKPVTSDKRIDGSLHFNGTSYGVKVRPNMTVKDFRDALKKAHPNVFKSDKFLKSLKFVVDDSKEVLNTSGRRSLAKFGVKENFHIRAFPLTESESRSIQNKGE